MACEDFEFSKFPYVWAGPCAVLFGDFEIFHKIPLCVVSVLWCVRTWSFQSSPSCVGCVLWRVRTLSFKVPICVSSVLWCVRTLSFKIHVSVDPVLWRVRTLSFQSSPVRGFCAVACGL